MTILLECAVAVSFAVLALPTVRKLQLLSYLPQRGYLSIIISWYYLSVLVIGGASLTLWIYDIHWAEYAVAVVNIIVGAMWTIKLKKPYIKFTNRVIRLIVVLVIVVGVACVFLPSFVVVFALPLVTLVAWLITLPYEGSVYAYYFNKAKKKLIHLQQKDLTVIAITGSYAKTSVKFILEQLLPQCVATPNSCNTPMGISSFVNNGGVSTHAKYLIVELGARRKGDIARLLKLIKPDASILTGIAPQHIQTFKSIENIKKEKAMLIHHTKATGGAVINGYDSEVLDAVKSRPANTIIVGQSLKFDIVKSTVNGSDIVLYDDVKKYEFFIPLIGVANALNTVLAVAMCKVLGLELSTITDKCFALQQVPHRMSIIKNGDITIIDDGYNANIKGVESCCATLDTLPDYKIAVSQGIVEGGRSNVELNQKVGELLGNSCNVVIAVGVNKEHILEGAKRTSCKIVLKADNINQAVVLAQKYYTRQTIVLFQNDIPQ